MDRALLPVCADCRASQNPRSSGFVLRLQRSIMDLAPTMAVARIIVALQHSFDERRAGSLQRCRHGVAEAAHACSSSAVHAEPTPQRHPVNRRRAEVRQRLGLRSGLDALPSQLQLHGQRVVSHADRKSRDQLVEGHQQLLQAGAAFSAHLEDGIRPVCADDSDDVQLLPGLRPQRLHRIQGTAVRLCASSCHHTAKLQA